MLDEIQTELWNMGVNVSQVGGSPEEQLALLRRCREDICNSEIEPDISDISEPEYGEPEHQCPNCYAILPGLGRKLCKACQKIYDEIMTNDRQNGYVERVV